jgi:VanZ family protein
MRRAFWPYSATRRAVNLSCQTGTCGYDPKVYKTVAIADPNLAPGLTPPLSSNSLVHEYPNITAALNAVIAQNDPVGFVAMSAICSHGMYSPVLEVIQRSIPGRHSQLIDWAASSSGAILGVFAVVLMARLLWTFVE